MYLSSSPTKPTLTYNILYPTGTNLELKLRRGQIAQNKKKTLTSYKKTFSLLLTSVT